MHELADAVRPRGRSRLVVHCAVALAGLLAAGRLVAAPPVPDLACSHQSMVAHITVDALRVHLDTCNDTDARSAGIARLNASELPQPRERFRMQAAVRGVMAPSSYHVDLFFSPEQAYLPDAGFDQLDQLIQKASQASQVLSLTLVGRGDMAETVAGFPRNVGLLRANHVLKYLRAAGLPQDVPVAVLQGSPSTLPTADDRAKDRSVLLELTVLKAQAPVDAAAAVTASGAGRGPVAAAPISNVFRDGRAAMASSIADRKKILTDSSSNADVKRELERLKSQLRRRLDDGMGSTSVKALVSLMVETDAAGMVQQAWVLQVRGPRSAAQRVMDLALATPSLGAFSAEARAGGADGLLFSVTWDANLPPPGTLVYESFKQPVYPPRAKRFGLEGSVIVRTQVQPDGRNTQVDVAESSGHAELDAAAVDAIRQSVFFPTRMPGPISKTIPIRFALDPPSYADRLRRLIRSNIILSEDVQGNPRAEVEVRLAEDGTILEQRLTSSSGNAAWDAAVLRALERTQRIPADVDGRVPPRMSIGFHPKY